MRSRGEDGGASRWGRLTERASASVVILLLACASAMLVSGAIVVASAASSPLHRPRAAHKLGVAVVDARASAALRVGYVSLRVRGPAGARVEVSSRLLETARAGARHSEGEAGLAPGTVALSAGGRAATTLTLTAAGRDLIRAGLARCDRLALEVSLNGRASRRLALAVPRCPAPGAQLARLIETPGGDFAAAARGRWSGRPARFKVGAAVADFSPPPAGHGPDDASDCDKTGMYDGPRPFAYVEPYIDVGHVGHFAAGDPYLDCNGNGRWDGNLLGGGASTPRYFTKVADPVTARAFVVSNGKQTIAVEVVDQEGLFNVYQQQIRARVAADGVHLNNIFISATHDESAPDSLGLGGIDQTTSGVDDYWVHYMIVRSAQAIEAAYHAMRPARIRYTETLEPRNVRQCWSSYPFVDDQHIPILQAVGRGGKVIVTLASVSQHDETLGFNSGTPQLDAEQDWVSSDWVNFFRQSVQRRFGGVAIEMAGSVGSNESPEVYNGPISRTPQQFIDASHPAGCRTLFNSPNGPDVAGTGHVPLGYTGETKAFGDDIAGAVIAALRSRSTYTSTSNVIWGARRNVCIPLGNVLFQFGAALGVFAHRPGYNGDCSVEYPVAPNGTTQGTSLLSQVASFQIGDGQFISVPGEAFPFTYLGSFLGPQDMPDPSDPMTPMLMPHLHAPFRFFDGLAEDMLGYIFPEGNAVGIPTAENPNAGDTDRFGCNHSDDAESTGADTGEIVGNALVSLLDAHDGRPETEVTGRYVLPDGTQSRDPLGGPDSLKCNTDEVFTPDGPAIGVELAGGRIVHPLAWMSLSGLPQSHPDRDTRGYFNARGRRVWLNVFPDVTLP